MIATNNLEILAGGFVVSGLLALGFLAVRAADLGDIGDSAGYVLTARFDNIGGLTPRAPVRTAGVTVGRVRTIVLDAGAFQGVVTLDIEDGVVFPRDTAARILSAGLLGDQFIGLEPGHDARALAPGDTIARTQSALALENLVGQFMSGEAAPASAAPVPAERPTQERR